MTRARTRGLTLIEILVGLAIMTMVSGLIYGSFDSMRRAKKNEGDKIERARQARSALFRIERELAGAFVSGHVPQDRALLVRATAFIGQNNPQFDRIDFASFAHIRVMADAPESDQAEIGYFVVKDPVNSDKFDLVRREQHPIDLEPKTGGIVNVLVEDVEMFDIRYLDPTTGQWIETWDTVGLSNQPNRLPLEVQIILKLAHVRPGSESLFVTKTHVQVREALSFGFIR